MWKLVLADRSETPSPGRGGSRRGRNGTPGTWPLRLIEGTRSSGHIPSRGLTPPEIPVAAGVHRAPCATGDFTSESRRRCPARQEAHRPLRVTDARQRAQVEHAGQPQLCSLPPGHRPPPQPDNPALTPPAHPDAVHGVMHPAHLSTNPRSCHLSPANSRLRDGDPSAPPSVSCTLQQCGRTTSSIQSLACSSLAKRRTP